MMVSLDGFFEGEGHDLSWHNVDSEFSNFAVSQLDEIDTLVFGARTYKMMADFWPTDVGMKADLQTATRMNKLYKIVFSRTLNETTWNNTELHKDDVASVIRDAKSKSGKDIAVFGSSDLCLTLIKEKLLEEMRIMVNPVVLGKGTTLFKGQKNPIKLALNSSREFQSGNILLNYRVVT